MSDRQTTTRWLAMSLKRTQTGQVPLLIVLVITMYWRSGPLQADAADSGSFDGRLMNGSSRCSGIIQIKHEDEWINLHGDMMGWSAGASALVCRGLGCGFVVNISAVRATEPEHVWPTSTYCDGTEALLADCVNVAPHAKNASSETKEMVFCSEAVRGFKPLVEAYFDGRLMDGSSPCNGILQFRYALVWKNLDGDVPGWSPGAASVACRGLGCGSVVNITAEKTLHIAHVWPTTTVCIGTEALLTDCITLETPGGLKGMRKKQLIVFCEEPEPLEPVAAVPVGTVVAGVLMTAGISGSTGLYLVFKRLRLRPAFWLAADASSDAGPDEESERGSGFRM